MQNDYKRQPKQLQPVQREDERRPDLPVSVPLSADGEEGATLYNLRLLQSSINEITRPQEVPPNRTITQRGNKTTEAYESTSTYDTVGALGLTPVRHPKDKSTVTMHDSSLPRPLTSQFTRTFEKSSDYVSGSLVSSWQCKESLNPTFCPKSVLPPLPIDKQRSSSADSVCRRFIKFTRRLATRTTSGPRGHQPLIATDSLSFRGDEIEEKFQNESCATYLVAGKESCSKRDKHSHWDLPPNYVDMIFSGPEVSNLSRKKDVRTGLHKKAKSKDHGFVPSADKLSD